MKPEDLLTDKIIDYCKSMQIIFVMGFTKTGKVSIARKLAKELNRELFIADEFIERYGHHDSVNQFELELDHCYHSGKSVIFEGILCFRLLRKIVEKGYFLPDMIIKTECNEQTIRHFYEKEEPNKNINRVFGFNSGLQKIWIEVLDFVHLQDKKLKVLTLNTSIY
jgi:2-phosphoglycerate kinase